MRLAQDDEMVHTLAPDRSDQPFGKACPTRYLCQFRKLLLDEIEPSVCQDGEKRGGLACAL